MNEPRRRLVVDITKEHQKFLDKHFSSWGSRKDLVYVLLEDLTKLVEEHGSAKVVGAIAGRLITINDTSKLGLKG